MKQKNIYIFRCLCTGFKGVCIIMATLTDVVKCPSVELLDKCTKDQLLKIAEHFEVDVPKQGRKDTIVTMLQAQLILQEFLPAGAVDDGSEEELAKADINPERQRSAGFSLFDFGEMTFEQRKEIMLLQYQQDSEREERATACEQETEMERLRLTTVVREAELQQERYKLDLIQEGKLSSGVSPATFDVAYNLRLLPKFEEKTVDSFFGLFERLSQRRQWSDSEKTMLFVNW